MHARGFCQVHYARQRRTGTTEARPVLTVEQRFWAKVAKTDGGCWTWTEYTLRGYGYFSVSMTKRVQAHRFAYELLVGPIPEGLTLDHTCHNPDECAGGPTCPHRSCVNPAHLEPTTRRENVMRSHGITARNAAKTECVNGHPFDDANTRVDPKTGDRCCRACACVNARRWREARRA